ncbi:MAG TPA: hypothetical protein PK715_09130, partial [Chitinophagales bacterium]|nr:hypothetical protein [Chitinophagales bacterium]
MLLCNPELITSGCVAVGIHHYDCMAWQQITWEAITATCNNFPGWRSIYGTPDFGYNATPTNDTQIRMWATDAAVDEPAVCCQRGEGIMAEVTLTPNTPYIFSYIRRIRLKCNEDIGGLVGEGNEEGSANMMPPGSCTGTYTGNPSGLYANSLDNLYVNLTNYDQITWNTSHYLQPAPANFENILHETNIGDTGWEKVFVCFTPSQNWNTLYIYPQQDNCNDLIYAYIDQAHLIQDDFMEMPTLLNATCQEAQNGIAIGWECNQMTDLQFTWEYSIDQGTTWLTMSETTPQITAFPIQSTWYRLSRSLAANPNYPVSLHQSSSSCLNASVVIKVTVPEDCIIPCIEEATLIGSAVGIPTASDADALGLLTNPVLYVMGDFTIDLNTIFTSQTVFMHIGAQIIVDTNNSLFINNTHILSACDFLWSQIRVFGKLTVTNNSLIEDAHYAIRAENESKIHVSETTFNKCFIGVFVPPSPAVLNNVVIWMPFGATQNFTGCTFTCPTTQNLLSPYPGASTFPNAIGNRPWSGLAVYDLRNSVTVGNDEPGNLPNLFANLTKGAFFIRCTEVVVTNADFDNINPSTPIYSSQDGRAISANNGSLGSPVVGAFYVLGEDGTPQNGAVNITHSQMGIYAQNLRFQAQNCYFNHIQTGISARGCSNTAVIVTYNTIENCTRFGIIMSVNSNTYHHISKNNIAMIGSSTNPTTFWGTGIELNSCTGAAMPLSSVDANNITLAGMAIQGINALNSRNIHIINNTILTEAPGAPILLPPIDRRGINISGGGEFSVNCNEVSSTTAANQNNTTALQVAAATDIFYSRNRFLSTFTGARFTGICTNTQLRGNEFNEHYWGLWLTASANLGIQNHLGNTWLNTAAYTYPTIGANPSASVRHDSPDFLQVALSAFYVNTGALPLYPPPPYNLQPSIVILDWFFVQAGCTWGASGCPGEDFTCTDTDERPERQMALNELENQIAADSIAVAVWEPELNRTADKELYDKLKTYPHLLTGNADAAYFVSQKDADIDGQLRQILAGARNAVAADSVTIAQTDAYLMQIHSLYAQTNALQTSLAQATPADTAAIQVQIGLLRHAANEVCSQLSAHSQNHTAAAHAAIDALATQNTQLNDTDP